MAVPVVSVGLRGQVHPIGHAIGEVGHGHDAGVQQGDADARPAVLLRGTAEMDRLAPDAVGRAGVVLPRLVGFDVDLGISPDPRDRWIEDELGKGPRRQRRREPPDDGELVGDRSADRADGELGVPGAGNRLPHDHREYRSRGSGRLRDERRIRPEGEGRLDRDRTGERGGQRESQNRKERPREGARRPVSNRRGDDETGRCTPAHVSSSPPSQL